MSTAPGGEVWWCSLAGSFIAHIDRRTGESTVVEPPTRNQGARRQRRRMGAQKHREREGAGVERLELEFLSLSVLFGCSVTDFAHGDQKW